MRGVKEKPCEEIGLLVWARNWLFASARWAAREPNNNDVVCCAENQPHVAAALAVLGEPLQAPLSFSFYSTL